MIGQVTPIGMEQVRWHFYLLFVICNFTNAVFFWSFLPETKKLPLEEMNKLFSDSPVFIGWRNTKRFTQGSIDRHGQDIEVEKAMQATKVDEMATH